VATLTSFLGKPSISLANGTASWDQNVMSAADDWNSTGADFDFTVTTGEQFVNPCGPCIAGYNPVFFTSTNCGAGFGDILELVNDCWDQSSGDIINAPVFVNSTVSWNAYDGPLRLPVYDIRRVLLHELGHVAGLDHPDAHGQNVSAIMNSHVSNLDRLQADDVAGIIAIYSGSPSSSSGEGPPAGASSGCQIVDVRTPGWWIVLLPASLVALMPRRRRALRGAAPR